MNQRSSNFARHLFAVVVANVTFFALHAEANTATNKSSDTTPVAVNKTVAGNVDDMAQRTSASGMKFQVGFRNIRYQGQIQQAAVQLAENERVVVKVALRNVNLMIANTNISGQRHGANCGPMNVTLGNRRELWLTMELVPHEVNMETHFKVVKADLQLPADNWTVGAPAWVKTWGFGMTQGKVVSGLRSGLMNNRKSVEDLLIKECPDLMMQIETLVHEQLANNQLAAD